MQFCLKLFHQYKIHWSAGKCSSTIKENCPLSSSYILKVPFNKDDTQGVAYVWIGKRADPEEGKLTEEIAEEMYGVCIYYLAGVWFLY